MVMLIGMVTLEVLLAVTVVVAVTVVPGAYVPTSPASPYPCSILSLFPPTCTIAAENVGGFREATGCVVVRGMRWKCM